MLLENGTEYFKAPEKFQVILETNVQNACPVVLNITRSLAPNSTDNFWGMVTFRPPIFQQSAFYSVVPGSYTEFGVSGNPTLNLLEGASPMQYDRPSVRNTAGTFSFVTKPDQSLGLQVVINLRDNPAFDDLQMAPFGKVRVCPLHCRPASTANHRRPRTIAAESPWAVWCGGGEGSGGWAATLRLSGGRTGGPLARPGRASRRGGRPP